jgi:hypothetical protein
MGLLLCQIIYTVINQSRVTTSHTLPTPSLHFHPSANPRSTALKPTRLQTPIQSVPFNFRFVSQPAHNRVSLARSSNKLVLRVFPNLTEQRVAKTDRHGLGLNVVLERGLAELAADTRLLVAAEG